MGFFCESFIASLEVSLLISTQRTVGGNASIASLLIPRPSYTFDMGWKISLMLAKKC